MTLLEVLREVFYRSVADRAVLISALLSVSASSAFGAQLVTRLSDLERSAGPQPAVGAPDTCTSSDGRWVTYGDFCNAYLRDCATGNVVVASPSVAGPGACGFGWEPSVSADGNLVAFWSLLDRLVPVDTNFVEDVFLFDRRSGLVRRISEGPGGQQSASPSAYPRISGDGATVVFWSYSMDLGPLDTLSSPDIYACDLASGAHELISVDSNGLQPSCGTACDADRRMSISFDGRFVAFATQQRLATTDPHGLLDVYVRDRVLQTTEHISRTWNGGWANNISQFPSISCDGRYVAFESDATNLLPFAVACCGNTFVFDRANGTLELANLTYQGVPGGAAYGVRLSCNGRFVAFSSDAPGFVANDLDASPDVFVRDRASGTLDRVTIGLNGAPLGPGYHSEALVVGDDGSVVLNASYVGMALGVPAGQPQTGQIFRFEPRYPSNAIQGYCTPKVNSLGCTPRIANIGFPSLTDNASLFVKALQVRSYQNGMLLWSRTQQSTPFGGGTLCVGAPVRRTALRDSGGLGGVDCGGQYVFHFSPAFLREQGFGMGDNFYAQFYGRDPGFAPPNNLTLTDAAAFTVLP